MLSVCVQIIVIVYLHPQNELRVACDNIMLVINHSSASSSCCSCLIAYVFDRSVAAFRNAVK